MSWVQHILEDYPTEYSFLKENWSKACTVFKTTPKKIFLVKVIPTTLDSEENRQIFGRITQLGKEGHLVRRVTEFQPCSVCKRKAIPTRRCYNVLKQIGKDVPKNWNGFCKSCKSC